MDSLVFLKECKSTNEEILKFLPADPADSVAVYTSNQTNGKGQYGNSWECPPNLNLAFTLAVSRDLSQDHLFNFRTAAVLSDFLAIMTKTTVKIKWPNDIIIKNKKVAGILTEKKNRDGNSYLLIGIGMNILQTDFADLPKAGSLLTQTSQTFDPDIVARTLYDCMNLKLLSFSDAQVMEKVNEKLFRKDIVSVFEVNGLRQNGIIKKVDNEGYLWVELENDGLQRFFHKEIEMLY